MPELPEVEVLRRSLEPWLVGDRLAAVTVREPRLRESVDREALRALAGLPITALERRAKYLLIHLEGAGERAGHTLVVHLGMSGSLTVTEAGEAAGDEAGAAAGPKHEHVVFALASGRRLRFRDPRRFGLVFTVPTERLPDDRHFAHLGVEPLATSDPPGEGVTGAVLEAAAEGRRGPVKTFLMDARVVVGVGNIYASEALFRAGIHPGRSVARIATRRWQRLAEAVRAVLQEAITQGGTTLADFFDGEGRRGYFQVSLSVYGREGEPCPRCGSRPIRKIVQANRSTFYCPGCQR